MPNSGNLDHNKFEAGVEKINESGNPSPTQKDTHPKPEGTEQIRKETRAALGKPVEEALAQNAIDQFKQHDTTWQTGATEREQKQSERALNTLKKLLPQNPDPNKKIPDHFRARDLVGQIGSFIIPYESGSKAQVQELIKKLNNWADNPENLDPGSKPQSITASIKYPPEAKQILVNLYYKQGDSSMADILKRLAIKISLVEISEAEESESITAKLTQVVKEFDAQLQQENQEEKDKSRYQMLCQVFNEVISS
jgi:tetratricopeptide (TPR) repeat protein